MVDRCANESHVAYARYGGRGIRVCDRWLTFENFLADMGERPDGMTLDRVDNDRDYELSNCRWATAETQARGRRSLSQTDAERIRALREAGASMTAIAKQFGIKDSTVFHIVKGNSYKRPA